MITKDSLGVRPAGRALGASHGGDLAQGGGGPALGLGTGHRRHRRHRKTGAGPGKGGKKVGKKAGRWENGELADKNGE